MLNHIVKIFFMQQKLTANLYIKWAFEIAIERGSARQPGNSYKKKKTLAKAIVCSPSPKIVSTYFCVFF